MGLIPCVLGGLRRGGTEWGAVSMLWEQDHSAHDKMQATEQTWGVSAGDSREGWRGRAMGPAHSGQRGAGSIPSAHCNG